MVARATASSFTTLRHCLYGLTLEKEPIGGRWSVRMGTAIHEVIEHDIMWWQEWTRATPPLSTAAFAAKHNLTARQLTIVRGAAESYSRWRCLKENDILEKGSNELVELPELSFGMDPTTGETHCVKTDSHRDYPFPKHWLAGTADLVVADPGRRLEVYDWKTGWLHVHSPAEGNWQLIGLAAMAAEAFGANVPVTAGVVRLREDGYHEASSQLDAMDLAIAKEELMIIGRKRMQGKLDPNPGDWCSRCPQRKVCKHAKKEDTV